MSKGETARVEIDPEWAYGKKGLPESKYPFLSVLFQNNPKLCSPNSITFLMCKMCQNIVNVINPYFKMKQGTVL